LKTELPSTRSLYVGLTEVADDASISSRKWIGLLFSGGAIVASILDYNPTILLERVPGIIDWLEDIVFTELLFVAAALLLYQVLGVTLQP